MSYSYFVHRAVIFHHSKKSIPFTLIGLVFNLTNFLEQGIKRVSNLTILGLSRGTAGSCVLEDIFPLYFDFMEKCRCREREMTI